MWLKGLLVCILAGITVASSQDQTPLYSRIEPPQPMVDPRAYTLDSALYNLLYSPQYQEEDMVSTGRGKRTGPSLSVVNPIDVLRSRLMMEIARRRLQKQDNTQLISNRKFLKTVGKRQALSYYRPMEKSDSDEYYSNNVEQGWESV